MGWLSIVASQEVFQFARWVSIVTLWVVAAIQLWAAWPTSWGILAFKRGKMIWYLPGEADHLKEIEEFLLQVRESRAPQRPTDRGEGKNP
jgi:hypothetical protein